MNYGCDSSRHSDRCGGDGVVTHFRLKYGNITTAAFGGRTCTIVESLVPILASLVAYATRDARFGTRDARIGTRDSTIYTVRRLRRR